MPCLMQKGLIMVELPDDWKFLNEVPEEWVAPPELRVLSTSSTLNLLLQIVSSDLVGNDAIAAAGKMISSYASLNAWIPREGARRIGFEGVSRIAAEISFVTRDVYHAWVAFREVFEPERRVGVGETERSALFLALEDGATRLDQLRNIDKSI